MRFRGWSPALAGVLALAAGTATAAVYMDGEVTLDYYIADVDADGYERPEAEFYVERVVNDSLSSSGPLSLSGWLTRDPAAGGAGTEAGYLPLPPLPGSSAREVWDWADAEDAVPGEYYVHALLQDDRYPNTFEDSRSLPPRLLWRGGLEAAGPLQLSVYGDRLGVDFNQLRNNRLDSVYTGDITLTLYATYGFGPASDGHVLCERIVPGLYAGDVRYNAGFDCWPNAIPDGEYSLHLMVAENGGRGGSSTLSGPDAYFHGGRIERIYGSDNCCVYDQGPVYYAGAMGLWGWPVILLMGLARKLRWKSRARLESVVNRSMR